MVDPIDELSSMVTEARKYFNTYKEKQRVIVKDIIRTLRLQEREADRVEHTDKDKDIQHGCRTPLPFIMLSDWPKLSVPSQIMLKMPVT